MLGELPIAIRKPKRVTKRPERLVEEQPEPIKRRANKIIPK